MKAASHLPIRSWIFKRSEQLDEENRRLARTEAKGCWEKPDDHTVWKGWAGEEQEATVGHGSLPPLPPQSVTETRPSHRVWRVFNGFAFSSLSFGWIDFGLFLKQIFNMDQDINVASKQKNLLCKKK